MSVLVQMVQQLSVDFGLDWVGFFRTNLHKCIGIKTGYGINDN